jgi:hypothetical protein
VKNRSKPLPLSPKASARTATQIRNIGIGALIALIIALAALYYQMLSLVQNSNALSTSVVQSLSALAADTKVIGEKLNGSQSQSDQLKQQVDQLSRDLETFRQRLPPNRRLP